MRTPDATLEHAAAPDWNIVCLCHIVNGNRFAEATHASDFDVDDSAGAQFNRSSSATRMVNRLVETDARLQCLLQAGVKIKIIVPQRLLDHEQVETIELFEVIEIFERISGVSITTE